MKRVTYIVCNLALQSGLARGDTIDLTSVSMLDIPDEPDELDGFLATRVGSWPADGCRELSEAEERQILGIFSNDGELQAEANGLPSGSDRQPR